MRTPKYYEATFSKLKKEWVQKAAKIKLTEAETINNKVKKTFTSYAHPNYLDAETLIAEKAGFNEIPAILFHPERWDRKPHHSPWILCSIQCPIKYQ